MNTPKNYLIGFLLLTTLGAGVLAWQQYEKLAVLRTACFTSAERADLQKRLWDSEKRRHELEAALKDRTAGPAMAAT